MSESEQTAFKTSLDANEKQMKSKRGVDEMGADEKGDGKGKGKGKGKGNAGGKPGDGAPPPGGDSDKAPPPPPFDPWLFESIVWQVWIDLRSFEMCVCK